VGAGEGDGLVGAAGGLGDALAGGLVAPVAPKLPQQVLQGAGAG
jgi:hypothetical protein